MLTERTKRFIIIPVAAIILLIVVAVLWGGSLDLKKVFSFVIKEELSRIASSIFDEKTDYLSLIASARQTNKTFVYESAGRRDPMASLVRKAPERSTSAPTAVVVRPPELSLKGIMWSENEPPIAYINGEPVGENDSIKGAKVLQIRPDSVTLIYRSQTFVLRLE